MALAAMDADSVGVVVWGLTDARVQQKEVASVDVEVDVLS